MPPAPSGSPSMVPEQLPAIRAYYDRALREDVMAFWTRHCPDWANGGYFHCLDRTGEVTDRQKNAWCQGRMVYTYSALHRELGGDEKWLELARLGRDFVADRLHRGAGRFTYQVTAEGRPVVENESWFADAFCLQGLAEFMRASGDDTDYELVESGFEGLRRRLETPGFNAFHHFDLDPSRIWHAPAMIWLGLAPTLRGVLGSEVVDGPVNAAMYQVLHVFARDDRQMLFENLAPDGSVIEDELGLRTNPGHVLESMWFAAEQAMHREDGEQLNRAIEVAGWAFDKGWDEEFGGLLAFVAPDGSQPPGPEVINAWGERWDDKVWWVHSEALYIAALAALHTGDPAWWDRWSRVHAYTFSHFPDPKYGDWYEYLHRASGEPKYPDKAKWIKSAFHVGRSLMKVVKLLDRRL